MYVTYRKWKHYVKSRKMEVKPAMNIPLYFKSLLCDLCWYLYTSNTRHALVNREVWGKLFSGKFSINFDLDFPLHIQFSAE